MVWATSHLQLRQCLHNKMQSSLLQHLRQIAGLPASAASWGVVRELQIQPLQRAWWTHILRFYNVAVAPAAQQDSPLMAEALTADMQLAVSQSSGGRTWCSDLLGALEELERGSATPTLREAAAALQRLPVTEVLALVDAAYEQTQLDASGGGDPRDPTTEHRSAAAYRAWFQSTAGAVLAQARSRTSLRECACVRTNLRLRLRAISTADTRGRRNGQQRQARCCQRCLAWGDGEQVEDALHVCFQ